MRKLRVVLVIIVALFAMGFWTNDVFATVYPLNISLCTYAKSATCIPHQVTSINVAAAGQYNLKVTVSRGNDINLYECQDQESFYMIINGRRTPVVADPDRCEVQGTVRVQNVSGTYNLQAGSNRIDLYHAHGIEAGVESLTVKSLETIPVNPKPTCSMNASPYTINQGQSTTLSWSSTNATSASINQGIGTVAVSGSRSVSPNITTTYTGTFTGPGGTVTCAKTITVVPVTPKPTCSMNASPYTINQGQSTTLSWSSTNATSASINQGIGTVAVSGSRSVSPSVTTTYTGTFTGAGGTVTCAKTITVIPKPDAPTCKMSISPETIDAGKSVTLSWSSTNATSASINQNIGAVAVNGSRSVSPSSTTTYTGTFTGPGGTVICSATVTVKPKPGAPTCKMSSDPSFIDKGKSSTISWSSTNATSASINQNIGAVAVNGSRSVSPSSTTTYTGTFTGAGGTVTCHTTVTVIPKPNAPTCEMNANPSAIEKGKNSTISWSSRNTTSASINQGIGGVAVSGSKSVSPSSTTTYTGTFTGAGGTVTCSATVRVDAPPSDDDDDDEKCRGSIGNYVWHDTDGDGVQDKDEKGIAGVHMKLTDLSSGKESSEKTSKNGHYEFEDLCEGKYKVSVKDEDVDHLVQTYDPDGTKNNKTDVKLDGNNDDHTKADFGYRAGKVAPATGSGTDALYVSLFLSLASIAGYLKIKRTKASLEG